ncbi:MAG: hypothetical protein Q7T01_00145 [bacterium]|nr:hypothetical protein [bacterium]
MGGISQIELGSAYQPKQEAREALARDAQYAMDRAAHATAKHLLPTTSFREIDAAMKRRDLTFDEAFVGMCYVLRATNRVFAAATEQHFTDLDGMDCRIAGREFLNGMAMKEAWGQLTPGEIAGMVTAAMQDLVVRMPFSESVLETCGTGGDLGLPPRDKPRKVINASTLSSLVVASLGIPTMKHGSYANTSAVGSTDAVERFGARIEHRRVADLAAVFERSGFSYTDAHVVKTIHDLSHLAPRHETVNHLIGPMTPPVAKEATLHKVMGVNEKVHPEDVALAYQLIHGCGAQRIGNAAIVTGLDADIDAHRVCDRRLVKDHAVLDELSPFASVVAFVRDGAYVGSHLMHLSDFGIGAMNGAIGIENTASLLQRANLDALTGRVPALTDYLAMNAGLALFVARDMADEDAFCEGRGPNLDALRGCVHECRRAIGDGRALDLLKRYVQATGGTFCGT